MADLRSLSLIVPIGSWPQDQPHQQLDSRELYRYPVDAVAQPQPREA